MLPFLVMYSVYSLYYIYLCAAKKQIVKYEPYRTTRGTLHISYHRPLPPVGD